MRYFIVVLIVLFSFLACNSKEKGNIDVSKINVDFTIKRFDVDFYNSTKENLPTLKIKYPFLFPKGFSDSIAIAKVNDKEEQKLYAETKKVYKNLSTLKNDLTSLFKHIKFYNSKFKSPNVITLLSNIDYNNRVIYADSLLLVSLDVYLGKTHEFYGDYPKYIKENNTKDHIIVDVAKAIINKQINSSNKRDFISKIIFEGKKMYFLDAYLPLIKDFKKIGYDKEKFEWAVANEEEIWKFFIENNLLDSTDTKLNKRFIENAPFSKFYREHDILSPGKIGVWIGWQIVRSFMMHNDVSLQELVKKDELEIFNNSKYKPKK